MKKLMRAIAVAGAAAALFGLTACNGGRSTLLGSPQKTSAFGYPESTEENFLAIKASAENFADEFTERACAAYDGGENFVVSPISVYSALAMAAECADGNTRQEILDAMNVSYELLRSDFLNLYRSVLNDTQTAKVTLSNSLWLGKGIQANESGVDALAARYGVYSYSTDFANDNKQANLAVKNFVKKQTNGLIDQNFRLSTDTFFALINTLYLKDNWARSGSELSLTDESLDFSDADGNVTKTKFMNGHYKTMRAHEGKNFTSCYTQTYAGYRLFFIVPKEGFETGDVMTSENLAEVKGADYGGIDEENKIRYNTRCVFPAFDAASDTDASTVLKEMGIDQLFDAERGADLSNICENDEKLFCPEVKHVAKLQVGRKGIEGAAVTVLPGGATSADPGEYEDVYCDFVADRAFGFVLTNGYGTTLFAGTVGSIRTHPNNKTASYIKEK